MGALNSLMAMVWNKMFRAETGAPPGPGDDYWYMPYGGTRNHAGVAVTPDIAIKSSALFAVVKVLAETMASLPLQMYRELGEGAGREPAPNHPLDELIRFQPNDRHTAIEFWEMMMFHAAINGCGYAEKVPGPRGAVDQLIPHPHHLVRVEVARDKTLRFKVSDPQNGTQRTLLQEEMFRIPGLSSDGVTGMRIVDVAAEAIGLGLAADGYAARIFSNNLNVGGYIKHPSRLTPEAQKNFIQAFVERTAGLNNAHRPIVLQEGMEFIRASDKAKDSQLLEARKWQIGEIARFFRVPLHMLNVDDQTNRSTVEAQALDFVKYTVRPWARRIEMAIRRDLIVATNIYSAKFNMDALLRGDSAARADYFAKGLGSGGHAPWLTVNEVRAIEGMNPVEGGDEIQAPVNNQIAAPDEPTAMLPPGGAEQLVRKEVAAIRKAAMRHAGDDDGLTDWVVAFYGGHVSCVMDKLGIEKEFAREYCRFACNEVTGAIFKNELSVLLDHWEDNRVEEIRKAENDG
jgi:HK97 family phage portal protein